MQNSTSTSGRRLAAAMFLGATSAAMVAGAAHADGGGITGAKYTGGEDRGEVPMIGPSATYDGTADTSLIDLKAPEGNTLRTYCIQLTVGLDDRQLYDEKDWAGQTKDTGIDQKHLTEIKWILNHSFPQADLKELSSEAPGVAGTLSPVEAVEGTQAAIWHFSDMSGRSKLDENNEKDANVVKLYDWLVKQAGLATDVDPPQASLTISPTDAGSVPAGSKQAFKLMSSDTKDTFISVALSGPDKDAVKLVDADGKAIAADTKFKSGDTVYVQLPNAASKGGVTLTASGTISGIEAGRVFVGQHNTKPTQSLILAQALNAPVSASATVKWNAPIVPSSSPSTSPSTTPSSSPSTSAPSTAPSTPAPSTTSSAPGPALAHTGAGNTVELAGGALALVAVGGGLLLYTRRNRKQDTGTHS